MHVCPLPSEKEDTRAAKKRKLQDEKNAEHKQDEESDSESDDSDSDSDSDSDYDVDNTLHSRPQTGKQRKSASEKAAKKDGFEVVPIGQPGENITPAIGPHLNGILAFSRSFGFLQIWKIGEIFCSTCWRPVSFLFVEGLKG